MLGVTFQSLDGLNKFVECDRLFRVRDCFPYKVELLTGSRSLGVIPLAALVSVEVLSGDEDEVFHYDRTPY